MTAAGRTAAGPTGRRPRIAVFGSGAAMAESDAAYQEALRLGRLIGEAGMDLATGGYDGTMAAVSRGVRESGGHVLGFPLALFAPLVPNQFLHEKQVTMTFAERLAALCGCADGYAVLRGGVGTLNELGYTWSIVLTGAVPPRPVVLVGPAWRLWLAFMRQAGFPLQARLDEFTHVADTPEAAVACLRSAFART